MRLLLTLLLASPSVRAAKTPRAWLAPKELDTLLDKAPLVGRGERDASKKLGAIADRYLAGLSDVAPEAASYLGLHAGDGALTSYDPKSVAARLAFYRRTRETLEDIDPAGLDRAEVVDFLLLKAKLDDDLDSLSGAEGHEIETFLFSPLESLSLHFLKNYAPEDKRARSALSRLEQYPEILAQGRRLIKNPPRIAVETALEDIKGARGFLGDAKTRLTEILPEEAGRIAKAAADGRAGLILFEKFLIDTLPKAKGDWSRGRKVFEESLKAHYLRRGTRSLKAETLKNARRSLTEIKALAKKLSPGMTWNQAVDSAGLSHESLGGVLDAYRRTSEKAAAHVRKKDLATLSPRARLEIVRTPEYLRSVLSEAAYEGPLVLDETRTGHVFITLPPPGAGEDEVEEWLKINANRPFIHITAVHEAVPGHHLQLTRQKYLKSRIRRIFWDVFFGEGWAHYAEGLMDESGFYDEETRLILLFERYWQLVRARAAIGLHAEGWSLKRASSYLEHELKVSAETAQSAAVRYALLDPVESLSYSLGRLDILRMRERSKKRLAKRFSLREFHDRLLSYGGIPLPMIEKLLERDWR